jgi:hypothetical protein
MMVGKAYPTLSGEDTGTMASPAKTQTAVGKSKASTSVSKATPTQGTNTTKETNAQKGTGIEKKQSPFKMGRFLFGMLILMVALQALQIGLFYLNQALKGALTAKPLFTLPWLGGVTPFIAIFMIGVAGIYWAMIRFKLFPSPRDVAATQQQQTAAKSGTGAKANPASPKAGIAKNSVGPKPAATTRATAGKGNIKSDPKSETPTYRSGVVSGEDDDIYWQVRAQQRAARKKRK